MQKLLSSNVSKRLVLLDGETKLTRIACFEQTEVVNLWNLTGDS